MGGCVALPLVGSSLKVARLTVGVSTTLKGYSNGLGAAVFGALAPATFISSGVVRQVVGCWWESSQSRVFFGVSGAFLPDSDAIFRAIRLNGVRYARASRNFYSGFTTYTKWEWTVADPIRGAGSVELAIEL